MRLLPAPFRIVVALAVSCMGATAALAADWPHWGGDASRNMVAPADVTGLPESAKVEVGSDGGVDVAKSTNVKWAAPLGSQSYGNAVVAGGRVYVGTNNDRPRDPKHEGDRGVLLCLDEQTGKLLWQLISPKLATGKVVDFEAVGLCSSPTVEGDRVYLITNRCEVLCLDA